MSIILVDTENLQSKDYCGIDKLSVEHEVVFFLTKNSISINCLSHLFVQQLLESKVKITYIKTDVIGKNALDFQIAAYAGKMISNFNELYILSHDKGFQNVISFLKKDYKKIKQFNDFLELANNFNPKIKNPAIRKPKTLKSLKPDVRISSKIKEILTDENDDVFLTKLIELIKCNDRNKLHALIHIRYLSKGFDEEEISSMYKEVRKLTA